MPLQIIGHPCKAKDLKPGDLVSTVPPETWSSMRDPLIIGERVYIRTEAPCPPDQADLDLFRIEVQRDQALGQMERKEDQPA